jgi:DNA-binding NtrC family response regulator
MTARKSANPAKSMSYHDGVNAAKRKLIEDTLRKTDGNVIEAAAFLDLHPTHLCRLTRDLFPKS